MNPLAELVVGPVLKIIDKLVPDADLNKQLKHDLTASIEGNIHERAMAQTQVNKVEAAHESLFVAGWRPSVGWVCSLAFALNFLIFPILVFVMGVFGRSVTSPVLDWATMGPVLLGMLGLGGVRTIEKVYKVAREV